MYRFYIDGTLLPVNPERLETKIKSKNKTIILLENGEVNLLKSPGLTETTFEALLPNAIYPFAEYESGYKPALYFINRIEELKKDLLPFRFIISRLSPENQLLFNTNMLVSLEDYSIKEDAENLGTDILLKIKLKQYREFSTKTLTLSEDGKTATIQQSRASKPANEFYIVRPGDTLYEIARRELGDGEKYSDIMGLNGIENTNSIFVGQVIRLV